MSYKLKKVILIILSLHNFVLAQEETNKIITLFIKEYPQVNKKVDLLTCESLQKPFNFGIFSTYQGYLNLTDTTGQITFPRKTVGDASKVSLNLLVTPYINPVFMFKNTIAYWKIEKNLSEKFSEDVPAKMYKIERKQDEETKLFFWEVTERKIPKNKQIPLHTIIILSKPEDIVISEGITPTTNNSQLVLPLIYAKQNNYAKNSLFAMTIKPFFSQNKKLYKERPLGYATHIT